ncbi:hypothetical protein BDA96_10G057200 [Sorghum bicolor]|uniref:Uncharacterized protein n=2 Tax=Sorghum bicolor TaxID=4558 RepID=A0A921PYQ0_SORBI|nr:hypothetical protein BDA96_10G057200 [Sorghum bicolor]KAG0512929.1 hypothetical protein BDA96_10G057200 [Sorghum bicolor]KXG19362.1 hypothetical protein SORBI_3010G048900 [Sorghum bicolor]KXG19363.1 hypothetical protein SORBI_3010G048900 [Sorghum bicolor]
MRPCGSCSTQTSPRAQAHTSPPAPPRPLVLLHPQSPTAAIDSPVHRRRYLRPPWFQPSGPHTPLRQAGSSGVQPPDAGQVLHGFRRSAVASGWAMTVLMIDER